jgi:hypothetical protein
MNYRFYSFVAGLYLSELQKGLQTAHAVSELFAETSKAYTLEEDIGTFHAFRTWATSDKTIVILSAANHAGVLSAYEQLKPLAASLRLPIARFNEDEQSMNSMCTACGVIVPEQYWGVKSVLNDKVTAALSGNKVAKYVSEEFDVEYLPETTEYEFIKILKSYPLA